ncbi:MAG: 4-hydroxy-3-methylbut-2-enyl diphosphate reductase [Bacteroidales bacterium]|nr:4-hydroxy-3-methylbut-2-enyl diphosphate reductase [Bacteroidales bacterium]
MNVVVDSNAGFCFGVVKAIGAAEEELAAHHSLYCLGDIVHNSAEVDRLKAKGLEVVDRERFGRLSRARVLIRAHGEPPDTYAVARRQEITLIDATCPIVLALQQKIRKGYEEMNRVGGQVVIFGKPGHAEVIGLNGQTGNSAIVINDPDNLDAIDFTRPIRLYSQTTKSREDYDRLVANIGARATDFVAHNTLCARVANRARELEVFARSVDLLLFVTGADSSNGRYLFEYCRHVQPNTKLLATPDELSPEWLCGVNTVGISGATSTPRWLMEEVKAKIESL